MSYKELVKKEDPIWGHYVAQPLGAMLAKIIYRTGITPNQLTFASLISAILAGLFFSSWFGLCPYYYLNLALGVLFLNIALILDCSDGQLARLKNIRSSFGAWFDSHSDRIQDGIIILGLALGYYFETYNNYVFIVAFLGIFLFFLRKYSTFYRDVYDLKKYNREARSNDLVKDDNTSQFKKSLKHSLFFKEADRVMFFTFFALISQVYLGLFIYMLIQLALASAAGYINYKKFAKEDQNAK